MLCKLIKLEFTNTYEYGKGWSLYIWVDLVKLAGFLAQLTLKHGLHIFDTIPKA